MLTLLARSIETELIHACRRFGLNIVIYNPLAGGLFSGKIKSKDIVPQEGRFSDAGPTGSMYRARYYKDETFRALQLIEQAVEKHGLTMIETAMRWLVHHSALRVLDGDDGIIIGVSSVDHLKNNLADLQKGPLPQEVVDALDQAWLIAKPTTTVYWHKELKYEYDTVAAIFKK